MTVISVADAATGSRGDPRLAASLKVTETFVSIQGEADAVGWPTFFIRLTGCPLRCVYCDTQYAFHGGERRTVDELRQLAGDSGVRHVCVTGGEPLAQKSCTDLLAILADSGFEVSLETSGAMDIRSVDGRIRRVVDIKTPASGEVSKNRLENLVALKSHDQVKIVICSREDYEWVRALVHERLARLDCPVLLSPSWGQQDPRQLAEWILEDRLDVRLQLQMHKFLWGEEAGR